LDALRCASRPIRLVAVRARYFAVHFPTHRLRVSALPRLLRCRFTTLVCVGCTRFAFRLLRSLLRLVYLRLVAAVVALLQFYCCGYRCFPRFATHAYRSAVAPRLPLHRTRHTRYALPHGCLTVTLPYRCVAHTPRLLPVTAVAGLVGSGYWFAILRLRAFAVAYALPRLRSRSTRFVARRSSCGSRGYGLVATFARCAFPRCMPAVCFRLLVFTGSLITTLFVAVRVYTAPHAFAGYTFHRFPRYHWLRFLIYVARVLIPPHVYPYRTRARFAFTAVFVTTLRHVALHIRLLFGLFFAVYARSRVYTLLRTAFAVGLQHAGCVWLPRTGLRFTLVCSVLVALPRLLPVTHAAFWLRFTTRLPRTTALFYYVCHTF